MHIILQIQEYVPFDPQQAHFFLGSPGEKFAKTPRVSPKVTACDGWSFLCQPKKKSRGSEMEDDGSNWCALVFAFGKTH